MQLKEQAKEREQKRKEEKVTSYFIWASMCNYRVLLLLFSNSLHSAGKAGKGERGGRQKQGQA